MCEQWKIWDKIILQKKILQIDNSINNNRNNNKKSSSQLHTNHWMLNAK